MAGIFGIVSENDNNTADLLLGTHYLQHRAQDMCGFATVHEGEAHIDLLDGLVIQKFTGDDNQSIPGNYCMGTVSTDRQPVHVIGKSGDYIFGFDGNLRPSRDSQYKGLKDSPLIIRALAQGDSFQHGIESIIAQSEGDFAIIALTVAGICAARGYGRKPLILGEKEDSFAISSESTSFINTGFEITRDVAPGEIVLISESGIETLAQLGLEPKYGTFEWVYTAYPSSIIDGISVSKVRMEIGKSLARSFPVDADIVSAIPNSGIWHAQGYSEESGLPRRDVFLRYDYSGRSFTPTTQQLRDFTAKTKLIPVVENIRGKRIIVVDDSIVRGTQMLNRVRVLRELGAKEVHARIACPPLMHACHFGQTTKKDEDCIASNRTIEEIRERLGLDSLEYATIKDLENAIGLPKKSLCTSCWGL